MEHVLNGLQVSLFFAVAAATFFLLSKVLGNGKRMSQRGEIIFLFVAAVVVIGAFIAVFGVPESLSSDSWDRLQRR